MAVKNRIDYFISFDVVKRRYNAAEITEEHRQLLKAFFNNLFSLEKWTYEELHNYTTNWVNENNSSMKEVANPLRWALTGRKVSPGIFEVAEQLGKEECKIRLKYYNFIN